MQIILLETLNNLGKAGEIVTVKDGFAKNHLIPRKKAIIASKKNIADLDAKMEQINKNDTNKIKEANEIKLKLDNQIIAIDMEANEDGNLYGNINPKVIIDKINEFFSIDLKIDSLILGQIRMLGEHKVNVRLYDNITAEIGLDVRKKT